MKILLCLFLTLPFIGLSQSSSGINASAFRSVQNNQYVIIKKQGKTSINDINGSPFITDDYVKGKIIDTKEDVEVTTSIKYSAYSDKFLIKLDDSDKNFQLPRAERYEYLYEGKRFFILINEQLFDDTDNKYVVKLVDRPELKLYKQYNIELNPGREARNTYDPGEEPSFYRNDKFYLKLAGNETKRLNTERKDFAAQFPANYQADMENFVYDKKLKFRKETLDFDVLRAMRYYLKIKNN